MLSVHKAAITSLISFLIADKRIIQRNHNVSILLAVSDRFLIRGQARLSAGCAAAKTLPDTAYLRSIRSAASGVLFGATDDTTGAK